MIIVPCSSLSMPKQAAVARLQPLKAMQVLLVEDEPEIAVLLTYLLEDKGKETTGD